VIDFQLQEAHEHYRDLIVAVMESLNNKFPMAKLHKVSIYPMEGAKNCPMPDCANRSLGDATEPGVIRLNGYWFSEPPDTLHSAGEISDFVPGIPGLRWHGGLPQPGQVLVHEFFHILRDGLGPEAAEFSHHMWQQATQSPSNAFSGYSMYNPSEWWAECGAGLILADDPNSQVVKLGRFLETSLASDDFTLFDPNKHPRGPEGTFRKSH
jgi:hypothetical protein